MANMINKQIPYLHLIQYIPIRKLQSCNGQLAKYLRKRRTAKNIRIRQKINNRQATIVHIPSVPY
jgi:hypothetical protein